MLLAYSFRSSAKNKWLTLCCLVFPTLYPSCFLGKNDKGFTNSTNNIRMRVSPCSIPLKYVVDEISLYTCCCPSEVCLCFPFTHELCYCFYNCQWHLSQFKTFNYPAVRHTVKSFLVIKPLITRFLRLCHFFKYHFVYRKLISASPAASFSCCLLFSFDIILFTMVHYELCKDSCV